MTDISKETREFHDRMGLTLHAIRDAVENAVARSRLGSSEKADSDTSTEKSGG